MNVREIHQWLVNIRLVTYILLNILYTKEFITYFKLRFKFSHTHTNDSENAFHGYRLPEFYRHTLYIYGLSYQYVKI